MFNTNKYIFVVILVLIITILVCAFWRTPVDPDILILPDFYSPNQFNDIMNMIHKTSGELKHDERHSQRKTYMYKNSNQYFTPFSRLLHTQSLRNTLERVQSKSSRTNEFPIEYRRYDSSSKGMAWHQDKPIFNGVYYECVLTLDNTSDSVFEYIQNNKVQRIKTKANTLICVTPNSIQHRVTPCKKGKRDIIKFVATFVNNTTNQNYMDEIYTFTKGT